MQRSDFCFDLPGRLIARYPLPERTASRLLQLNGATGQIRHRRFVDLLSLLQAHDLLVFNDTRVLPARLWGQKASGGKVEILLERLLSPRRCLAHVRAGKAPCPGSQLQLRAGPQATATVAELSVLGRADDLFLLQSSPALTLPELLQQWGHMPLPPYIDREDEPLDRCRYQTVFGRRDGAVAAPTAGLHFSTDFIEQCRQRGADIGFITLHVAAGTFQPVRVDAIADHRMHAEYLEVSAALCRQITAARARGGRVVAVGTTVVRALETAAGPDGLQAFAGDSRLFIYPGYRFRAVDALLTNFHLPESTLLMLVSAFAGRASTMRAYSEAVAGQYRFFSYGDAMFIEPARRVRERLSG